MISLNFRTLNVGSEAFVKAQVFGFEIGESTTRNSKSTEVGFGRAVSWLFFIVRGPLLVKMMQIWTDFANFLEMFS